MANTLKLLRNGAVGFIGWLDGLFMLRREWCLVAGLRRPLSSSKRDSVKLDRVVVELLECDRVVPRSLSEIGVFAVVFLGDFGIAHIVKNDLITFDVPLTIAIQPRVVPHRDRAPVGMVGLECEYCDRLRWCVRFPRTNQARFRRRETVACDKDDSRREYYQARYHLTRIRPNNCAFKDAIIGSNPVVRPGRDH